MPQSLARILVHLVFSTRNREPLIDRYGVRLAPHPSSGEPLCPAFAS